MGTLAVETKPLLGIKRVPQCNYIHRVDNIISGRSPPLYCTLTLISMQSPGLQCSNMVLHGLREIRVSVRGDRQMCLFVHSTIPLVLSACPLHTNSGCGKERRILIGPW